MKKVMKLAAFIFEHPSYMYLVSFLVLQSSEEERADCLTLLSPYSYFLYLGLYVFRDD